MKVTSDWAGVQLKAEDDDEKVLLESLFKKIVGQVDNNTVNEIILEAGVLTFVSGE